jgi:acyl-CoA reductase-like NAD-dependent aldehyde dehydrogenase
VVADAPIADALVREFKKQGAHFLDEEESARVRSLLFAGNRMNPKIVGKSAQSIAEMAGIQVPPGTRVLISKQTEVAKDNPYSREKLCPVLGFYIEDGWERACRRCVSILENEGAGHTMVIHSRDEKIIGEFAMKKAVSRLLVNTPGALGGVGATTNLAPALTLGCGAVGKSATSDNITPLNLVNIRRVAAGCRSLEELRREGESLTGITGPSVPAASVTAHTAPARTVPAPLVAAYARASGQALSAEDVDAITELVMEKLSRMGR